MDGISYEHNAEVNTFVALNRDERVLSFLTYDNYIPDIVLDIAGSEVHDLIENKNNTVIYLSSVWTDPEFENKGLATKLISKLVNEESSKDTTHILIALTTEDLIKFYKDRGFEPLDNNKDSDIIIRVKGLNK